MKDRPDGRSLEELEAEVPDAWVVSMYDDVRVALNAADRGRATPRPGRWRMPALAAAVVALLLSNLVTVRALTRAEARAASLTEAVLDQQRRLVRADERSTATSAPIPAAGREGWLKELRGRDDLTVADLRALLRELPSGTPVVGADRVGGASGVRFVPAAWRDALARLDGGRAITAGDLLDVLDDLDLPPGATVPAGRILDFLS